MLANLEWAIARRGVKKYQLARAAGMSESKLSLALHGRREFSPQDKQIISEILGFDPDWLFERYARPPVGASVRGEVLSPSALYASRND